MKGTYMPSAKTTRRTVVALLAAAAGLALNVPAASAAPVATSDLPDGPALARNLARKVTVGNINRHLIALQRFADQTGGNGTRAASTQGHTRSAEYIASKLETAGFTVTRQEFPFTFTQTLAQNLTVGGTAVPVRAIQWSPSTPVGGITAPIAVVPVDDTPGCEASDYAGLDVTGKIALVKRGFCTFTEKSAVAAAAGAVAVIAYNNAAGPLNARLDSPTAVSIPVGGVTMAAGEALAAQPNATVRLEIRTMTEQRTSYNVIAETQTGRHDNVVMAGAHLDGSPAGPGINDNGSGSAMLLEAALQLGGLPRLNNAVRFAWWSAGEMGVVGSTFYVDSLDFEEQLNIALYLNFDMLASPNAGRFVWDGDDSDHVGAGPGPFGSAQIEAAFAEVLAATGVETEGTDFDGRSDYSEFLAVGIPAGGLFAGAEEMKTDEQAAKWGGVAGQSYDSCFRMACDNLGNLDRTVLDSNADAAAFVLGTYAISTEDINGVPPGDEDGSESVSAAKLAKAKSTSAKARFAATVKTIKAGKTAAHDDHDLAVS
jgi:Zn-dependent M28 family amino/carboxypeptidase